MKKFHSFVLLLLLLLFLFPALSNAEVTAYSIYNTFGDAPQTILITLETSADVKGVKLVNEDNETIAASIAQSSSNTGKQWELSTVVNEACSEEWTIYLKKQSGDWMSSDITFFVDISSASSAHTAYTNPPRPTATPRPDWSYGTFSYVWADTKEKSDNRVNSHSGPANSFMDSGSYRTRKITGLSALFREKYSGVTWTYAEMHYQNGYKRRVYFKNGQILHGDVPFITFTRTPARLTSAQIPTYGPAPDYDDFEDERYQKVTLEANYSVSILHEENNYFFIEFIYSGKECRAWVPVSAVAVD